MAYPYTIQDLLCGIGASPSAPTGGVWAKLSQRADVFTLGVQWVADAVLELSQNYPFQGLQRTTAAPVQMTTGVYQYPFSTWVNAGDIPAFGTTANPKLIPSFFMFYNNPLNTTQGYNPGIGLSLCSALRVRLHIGRDLITKYLSHHNPLMRIGHICGIRYSIRSRILQCWQMRYS